MPITTPLSVQSAETRYTVQGYTVTIDPTMVHSSLDLIVRKESVLDGVVVASETVSHHVEGADAAALLAAAGARVIAAATAGASAGAAYYAGTRDAFYVALQTAGVIPAGA